MIGTTKNCLIIFSSDMYIYGCHRYTLSNNIGHKYLEIRIWSYIIAQIPLGEV